MTKMPRELPVSIETLEAPRTPRTCAVCPTPAGVTVRRIGKQGRLFGERFSCLAHATARILFPRMVRPSVPALPKPDLVLYIGNLTEIYDTMLAKMGIVRPLPAKDTDEEILEREHRYHRHRLNYGVEPSPVLRAPVETYTRNIRGVIQRITPKRDHSMSARQWKKHTRLQRLAVA